jgi:hypothetical protein
MYVYIGKYSFVNRTIKSWNQLPASLLASFPCKLNTFRKRVKSVVTSKEFKWGLSVNKWSDMKCSDVGWTDVIYVKWFYFKVKWIDVKWSEVTEVSYGEVLADKGAKYIRVTLYCGHLIILRLFHLGVSCTVFVLICTVVVLYCYVMCVCVGFVMCVCVGFVMCGCFGNMYTVLWLRVFLRWLRFFLSCKANAGVKLALFHISCYFVLFGCYLCCSVYCLCVNVYCHRVTTQLQLINISYHTKTRHGKWKNFKVIIIWSFTSNRFLKQSVKRRVEINVST